MSNQNPQYSSEEAARRGDEIYGMIRNQIEDKNSGDIVAIDLETEAFAVWDTSLAASKRLLAQYPNAEICWCESEIVLSIVSAVRLDEHDFRQSVDSHLLGRGVRYKDIIG